MSDSTTLIEHLKRNQSIEYARVLALFSNDPLRAARALWASLESIAEPLLRSALFPERDGFLHMMVHSMSEISSQQVLELFTILDDHKDINAKVPYGSKIRGYPAWALVLEIMLRQLPERTALLTGWRDLRPALQQTLAFCLARLGELDGEVLTHDLPWFAEACAECYTWCEDVFQDAERVFGEHAWRSAVAHAAASSQVKQVGMWPEHFAPYVPYRSDEQLFRIVHKLTWSEYTTAPFFFDRGPAMDAFLQKQADAIAVEDGLPSFADRLTLHIYACNLEHTGKLLAEQFDPLALQGLQNDTQYAIAMLRTMPPQRRDALIWEWLQQLEMNFNDDYDVLILFATPAIRQWAVDTFLKLQPFDSMWFEAHLINFGPEIVPVIAAVPKLLEQPSYQLSTFLSIMQSYPSATAAAVAAMLMQHADPALAMDATNALAAQLTPDLVDQAQRLFETGPTTIQPYVVKALAARFYEPELRMLAAAQIKKLPKKLQIVLQPAIQALPDQVAAYIERLRALDQTIHKQADDFLLQYDTTIYQQQRALGEMLESVGRELGLVLLYRFAIRQSSYAGAVLMRTLAGDEEALWFYVLCCDQAGSNQFRRALSAFGKQAIAPLRHLWQTPRIRQHISPEDTTALLETIAEIDTPTFLNMLGDAATRANKERRSMINQQLKAIWQEGSYHSEIVALLHDWLLNEKQRTTALEVAATTPMSEVSTILDQIAPALTKDKERKLVQQAQRLIQLQQIPVTAQQASDLGRLPYKQLAFRFEEPIKSIKLFDRGVAAATTSDIVVLAGEEYQPQAHLRDMSYYEWCVGRDGAWIATFDDGISLFDTQGEPVQVQDEDDEESDYLYPNDGISGMLPLANNRLLVWAVGHNVYEPLTLYDARTGTELQSRKLHSFAYNCAPTQDGTAFVMTMMDGTVELRSATDASKIMQVGKTQQEEESEGWSTIAVCSNDEQIVVVESPTMTVFARQADQSYRELLYVPDIGDAAVVSNHRSAYIVVVHQNLIDVYCDGVLRGRIALPTSEQSCYSLFADSSLLVAVENELLSYELETMILVTRQVFPSHITALASDAAGWVLGTETGELFRGGLKPIFNTL